MRVALVAAASSAPWKALRPLIPEWEALGLTITVIDEQAVAGDDNFFFDDYDIVHFGYAKLYEFWIRRGGVTPPATANTWNVGHRTRLQETWGHLAWEFAHIFVDDVTTLQALGQSGYTKVSIAPMTLSTREFHALPAPPEFTVGTFCTHYPDKRVEVIVDGAKQAGVECLAFVFPSQPRSFQALDPLQDVYARLSVYIHASFTDTNSLTAMEALACGRPVIATRSAGLSRVLQDGFNGCYFDGSAEDLAKKIRGVRSRYEDYARNAAVTPFPPISASAAIYARVWREIVSNGQEAS
jgi:hypothetical protein